MGNPVWMLGWSIFKQLGASVTELWAPIAALSSAFFLGAKYSRFRRPISVPASEAHQLAATKDALNAANEALSQARGELERFRRIEDILEQPETNLWSVHKASPPTDYARRIANARCKIITVANLKGGVGKTTLVSNLAAYFDRHGQRALLLDLDFQGSLSDTLLQAAKIIDVDPCVGTWLDNERTTVSEALHQVVQLPNILQKAKLVTAGYNLTEIENRMMARWLFKKNDRDTRYNLARFLLSDEVQKKFDIVLIDAPPRLSFAAINALCASTHVLIPTVADQMSSDAVTTFLKTISDSRIEMNPGLRIAGIVPTLTQQGELTGNEEQVLSRLRKHIATLEPGLSIFHRHLPRRADIARAAGVAIASQADRTIREMFEALGDELCSKIGLITAGAS